MISGSSRPRTRGDLQQSDLDDGCVIYDRDRETAYTLNVTASLIWAYLDGALSLLQIAGEVSSVWGSDMDTALRDVVNTVTVFEQNGLLDGAGVGDGVNV